MYSRDISKKVLAGCMTLSRQGKFCGGPVPLGLMRDPNDRGHLIVDPETAPTIKTIYDLASNCMGSMRIAKHLMEHKIPITRLKVCEKHDINYYFGGIARINFIPCDEREITEDCHEAIVSREQWEQVQRIIDRRPLVMQGNHCPFYNLFHGLVYCATCGKSMQVRYENVGRIGKNRFTGEMRKPIDKAYYICQTYNRLGKNACASHKIEARDLYNLVLSDIIEHGKMALQDSEAFYGRLTCRLEQQYSIDEVTLKKDLTL